MYLVTNWDQAGPDTHALILVLQYFGQACGADKEARWHWSDGSYLAALLLQPCNLLDELE
jgi:hypothetical protein